MCRVHDAYREHPSLYIGRDLFGGAFSYDAWELYAAGVLTNPVPK